MALVERIMHWGSREGEVIGAVPENTYIAVHLFFAAQAEVVANQLTRAAVKSYLNMSVDDASEYDALANLAPSTDAGKALYLERLHSVFMLAEKRVPSYDTPTNVRTKLGL